MGTCPKYKVMLVAWYQLHPTVRFPNSQLNWWFSLRIPFFLALWLLNIAMENHHFTSLDIGKSSKNWPFSGEFRETPALGLPATPSQGVHNRRFLEGHCLPFAPISAESHHENDEISWNIKDLAIIITMIIWQCVKTLYPFCSHQNSW